MKKIVLFLLLGVLVAGCSKDEDVFDFQLVTVREAFLPDTLVKGETYNFEISYNRPTNCHAFAGFDYEKNGNEREIAIINAIEANRNDCVQEEGITGVATLNFVVERDDFYIFKFYQGEDENGTPLFLSIEIPVEQD